MTLDGGGKAILEGGGRGTVLTLAASGATVRGLRLTGSGDSHDGIDAGLLIEGDDNLVENNALDDVLFGIHVRQGNRNRILNNRVTGRPAPRGARGDGLRLWNSRWNRIEGNAFAPCATSPSPTRPTTASSATRSRTAATACTSSSRRAPHVENNRLSDTDTGIAVLYSPDLVLRGNSVAHALDGGGAGIALKDSGSALVEGNEILHCAAGLSANAPLNAEAGAHGARQPLRPQRRRHVLLRREGRPPHRGQPLREQPDAGGGQRRRRRRRQPVARQLLERLPGLRPRRHDGVGDTPHEIWLYADRIWMETPKAKFFANSPALELLDLLERLAPFASPSLILRDPAPRMAK
jgi:nitrous oxidase accessory protein